MLGWGNVANDSTDGTTTFHSGGAVLKGGRTYIMPWIATARDLTDNNNANNTVAMRAARTSMTPYMVGLKERIQVQTNNGATWQWRRICFRFKGNFIYAQETGPYRLAVETSNGWRRILSDWGNGTPSEAINQVLFDGVQGVDWQSYFAAKTSRERVTVCYDQTRIIQSGNASGVMRNYSVYHPMNKTLVYDDEENGQANNQAKYSTAGNGGMGDYYVVDYIAAGTGTTTSDLLSFDPTATLYWHEK